MWRLRDVCIYARCAQSHLPLQEREAVETMLRQTQLGPAWDRGAGEAGSQVAEQARPNARRYAEERIREARWLAGPGACQNSGAGRAGEVSARWGGAKSHQVHTEDSLRSVVHLPDFPAFPCAVPMIHKLADDLDPIHDPHGSPTGAAYGVATAAMDHVGHVSFSYSPRPGRRGCGVSHLGHGSSMGRPALRCSQPRRTILPA